MLASLDFVRGIHRWPVDSPYKGPATRKMFPFGDVIMKVQETGSTHYDDPMFKTLLINKNIQTSAHINFQYSQQSMKSCIRKSV